MIKKGIWDSVTTLNSSGDGASAIQKSLSAESTLHHCFSCKDSFSTNVADFPEDLVTLYSRHHREVGDHKVNSSKDGMNFDDHSYDSFAIMTGLQDSASVMSKRKWVALLKQQQQNTNEANEQEVQDAEQNPKDNSFCQQEQDELKQVQDIVKQRKRQSECFREEMNESRNTATTMSSSVTNDCSFGACKNMFRDNAVTVSSALAFQDRDGYSGECYPFPSIKVLGGVAMFAIEG